jgi:hypothetical protein
MTYENETQEIEAPGFMNDPKVLAYLEGTDADISRLVLKDNDKLWAYSKRAPADLCRSSLEDLVAVAFPAYFPAITQPEAFAVASAITVPAVASDVAPSPMTTPAPPKAPRAIKKPRKALAPYLAAMPLPVTGAARGLLARRFAGSGRPPSVLINGVPRMVPKPMIEGAQIKVALRDPLGSLVGYAVLSRTDYCTLIDTPSIKADTMLWTLNAGGEVTTRVRGAAVPFQVRTVNDLLLGIRSASKVAIEMQAGA